MGLEERIERYIITVAGEHVTDLEIERITKEILENKGFKVVPDPVGSIEASRDTSIYAYAGKNKNGDVYYKFEIRSGTQLNSTTDKKEISNVERIELNAEQNIEGICSESDIIIKEGVVEKLGGGATNLIKALYAIGMHHNIEYIGINPEGSEEPFINNRLIQRLIKVKGKLGEFYNLVFKKVYDNANAIIRGKRICKHPKNEDIEIDKDTIGLKKGLVVVNSLGYKNLTNAIIDEVINNGDDYAGVIILTDKFKNEKDNTRNKIREKALAAGFIAILNEGESKYHTKIDCGIEDSLDYGRVILELYALRGEQNGKNQRIYLTLGSKGSICVDEEGKIHWSGVYKPGKDPKNTNGGGDSYAAGVCESEYQNRFVRDRDSQLSVQEIMQLATATARARIDENLTNNYINELLSNEVLSYFKTEKTIDEYVSQIGKRGLRDIHEEIARLIQNCKITSIEHFLQPYTNQIAQSTCNATKPLVCSSVEN